MLMLRLHGDLDVAMVVGLLAVIRITVAMKQLFCNCLLRFHDSQQILSVSTNTPHNYILERTAYG